MTSCPLIILEVIQSMLQIVYLMFPNGFSFQILIPSSLVSFSLFYSYLLWAGGRHKVKVKHEHTEENSSVNEA